MFTQSSRSRLLTLGCMTLAASLVLPPRLLADPLVKPGSLLASAHGVVAREAGAMKAREAAQAQPAPSTDLRSGSFFKSKAGVATLVLFAAGVAYAVYSSSNDRIRSTGR